MNMNKPRRRRTFVAPRASRTRKELLLDVLCDGRPHTTNELLRRVGHRFSASKHALSREGYVIDVYPHPRRRWQYLYQLIDVPREKSR